VVVGTVVDVVVDWSTLDVVVEEVEVVVELRTISEVVDFDELAGTNPTGMYPSWERSCSSQRMSTPETSVFE
jgi:hypothetical protein